MNARAVIKWAVDAALILCAWSVLLWTAPQQKNRKVREQPGNTIVMDDGFEYRLVDYGVGRLELRDDFSPPVFWMKFRITNTSEHLVGVSRYDPSRGSIKVADNWGNIYETSSPRAVYGLDWEPLQPTEAGVFKPGEARSEIMETSASEFVEDIHELYAYLNFPYYVHPLRPERYHAFVLREPMSRHRDWLRDLSEPSATELRVTTGVETRQPSTTPSRHRSPSG